MGEMMRAAPPLKAGYFPTRPLAFNQAVRENIERTDRQIGKGHRPAEHLLDPRPNAVKRYDEANGENGNG